MDCGSLKSVNNIFFSFGAASLLHGAGCGAILLLRQRQSVEDVTGRKRWDMDVYLRFLYNKNNSLKTHRDDDIFKGYKSIIQRCFLILIIRKCFF